MKKPIPNTKKEPLETITIKGASVAIYWTPSKKAGREYPGHTLSYTEAGKRRRAFVTDFEKAKSDAKNIARQLSEGTGHVHALTPSEVADFTAAVKILRQHPGMTLTEAIAEWSRATQTIKGGGNLHDAVTIYNREKSKTKLTEIKVGDLVKLFVDTKSREELSVYYLDDIERKLKRFSDSFRCHISGIRSEEIQQWLDGLPGGQRNANNLRSSVATLFSFARERGYLPKEQKHAAEQVTKAKERPSKIGIYTPEEMGKILTFAQERFIPALAVAAFAGLRSAEIFRLEWQDIKMDRGHIVVAAEKAKTASRRLAPLTATLRAWLAPHAKKEGRIAPDYHNLDNLTRQFTNAAKNAKVKPQRNGFRHSFASYRLATEKSADAVALEMGNSPRKLFTNYRELVTEDEGKSWFSITPKVSSEKVVSFAA